MQAQALLGAKEFWIIFAPASLGSARNPPVSQHGRFVSSAPAPDQMLTSQGEMMHRAANYARAARVLGASALRPQDFRLAAICGRSAGPP